MDRESQTLTSWNLLRSQRRWKAAAWAIALLTAWLLSLVVVTPVAAQTEITPSTPCFTSTNLTNLSAGGNRGITNQPVLSGNGARVAFWSVNNLGGGNVDGNIEVFVRETANSSVVQLTNSVGSILGGFNLEPSINTAGTHIAFYSDRDLVEGQNTDGNFEIFLARRATNGTWTITQVTRTQGSANLFPAINAAGNRIAFVSDDSELHNIDQTLVNADRNFEIYLAIIPNSGAVQFRQLTNTGAGVTNDQPVINAAGNRVAYTAATGQTAQVFVWDENQNAPAQLTQTDTNDQVSISADGTSMVYIATTADDRSRVVLHTLSADGTESRAEVIVPAATTTKYRSPSISGNGERVVYVSEQGTGAALQINVLLYDINTGLGVPISEVGGGTGEQPAISSDGTRVTFVGVQSVGGSTDNTGSDIYVNECPQADLTLETVGNPPATVLAGVDVTYQFRVTNNGPSIATDAFFRSDLGALPGLPANVDRLLPPGCSTDSDDILVCQLGDIAVGASRTFTMGYDIPSNAGLSDIVSQIEVRANVVDPHPDDNKSPVITTRVFEEAALSMVVTTDRSSILAGSQDILTYDLIVTSAGPSQARSTRITDTLPVGSSFVSVALVQGGGAGANCPLPSSNVATCQLGNLTAGSITIVRIRVRAVASAPPTLTNVATVRSLTQEFNLANNTVVTQTPVERSADMAITKTASPADFVIAGREITYTLTFTNNGFSDTENATVIDSLPQNVVYVRSTLPTVDDSCTPEGGGQIVTCDFPGPLVVGANRTFSIVALVQEIVPAGLITNTARILSDRSDPNPVNDVTPPVATEVRLLADLVISKSVNTTTPDIFEVFTYTVKLRNDGPSQAYNVVVTDILPSELTFIAATASTGSYSSTTGLWTVGTLPVKPVGQEETLTIRVSAIASAGGDNKLNTATAGGSQPEPDNDLPSSDSVSVIPQRANISVVKSSTPTTAQHVIAGKRLTYTLTVRNNQFTTARSVVLTDVLPANVFLVSVTQPNTFPPCATSPTIITCDVGNINVNQQFVYTVVITRSLRGAITNTVSVSTETPDLEQANNTSTHSILVDPDVPDNLVFTTQPGGIQTAGVTFTPTVRVALRDRFNNFIDTTVGNNDVINLTAFTNASCTTPVTDPLALNNEQVAAASGVAIFASLNYTRAESIYLRAADITRVGVDAACSTITAVNPDSTKKLVITTPPRELVAGKVSQPITVQRQDQFGNPTTDAQFVVNLADSSPSGLIINASNTPIPNLTIPNLQSSATFFYTDTVIGTYAITVSAGSGVTSFSQPITVVAAPASKLLIVVSAPTVVTAGVKSDLITIARVDDFDNENTTDPTLTVALDSDSPVADQFYRAAIGDNTVIVTTSIPVGQSRAEFRYRNTLAETHELFMTDQNPSGLLGASTVITVVPAVAHHLIFTTTEKTVTAGELSTIIRVAREDQFNNRNFNDPNLNVTLTSNSTGAPDFVPDSPVTIAQGNAHAEFQYSDTLAGVFTITASSGVLVPAAQRITVNAAAANNLVVLTAPQVVIAGQPSNTITIQRRDQFGNPAPNGGNLNVGLSSTSSTEQFLQAATPTVIASITIPSAGTNASFRYRDTSIGVFRMDFNGGGTFVASQTITVTAANAAKLVFTQKPASATAGIRSDVFVVERQDQFSNPTTTGGNITVNLSSNSPGTPIGGQEQFIGSNGVSVVTSVQIPTGSPTTTFFYRDTFAGIPQITAASGVLTPAITTIMINPDAADQVDFTLPATPVVAGVPSGVITAQVQDQYANPVTPTIVSPVILNLTTTADQPVDTPAEFRDALNASLTITRVTIGGSDSADFRYFDTKAATPSIVATDVGPLALGQFTQPITVNAAAAAKVQPETLANGNGTVIASRNVTAGTTVQLFAIVRDAFDNFISNPTTATWTITTTGGVLASDTSPTTGASTTFTGRVVGTAIIVPHVTNVPSHIPSGTLTVIAGAANRIRVESANDGSGSLIPAQNITAGTSITVYAITRDSFNNFVANPSTATWTIITQTGGVSVTADLVTVGGRATFTGHKVGTGGIRASLVGISNANRTPTGLLTVVKGAAAKVRPETLANGNGTVIGNQNVTAGTTVQLFAIVRDAFDNFISNPTTATWTITTTGGVLASDTSPTTGASTTFTGRVVGTAIIVPHVTDVPSHIPSGTLTVIAGAANRIRVESANDGSGSLIPAQNITAGQVITVYAIRRDSFNNFIDNPSTAAWTIITRTAGVSTTDWIFVGGRATFTARKVGTTGVRATHSGITTANSIPTGLLTVVTGPIAKVRPETLNTGNGTVVGNQNVTAGQEVTLYAVLRDAFDNFISSPTTATWTITTTGGVLADDMSATMGQSTVFTGRKVGTAIIVPHVTDVPSHIPSGTLTVIAGTANRIRVESNQFGTGSLIPAQNITAGQVITVYAIRRDSFDNFIDNPSTATWDVITNTGGVLTTDWVTSGGRATFTARKTGTTGIRASHSGIANANRTPTGLLTVVPGNAVYLDITRSGSGNINAGATTVLNITAYDVAENVATSYTGNKNLIFSGALSSTNPITGPRVFNQSGTQIFFGQNTSVFFNSGVMSTTNNAGTMRLFRSGTSIAINVADANDTALDSTPNGASTGTLTVNVVAAALHRLKLSVVDNSLTAGVAANLTITAQDQYGNTRTDYTGNKDLRFSSTTSINAPNGNQATVSSRTGSVVNFGTDTSISFSSGVAAVSGSNNGVLTIYRAGSFRLNVFENDADDLPASNPAGDTGIGYLDVTVGNSPNQTIAMQLTSPQTVAAPFAGTNLITITDAYQNPVTINAANRPVTLTTSSSLNGVLRLSGSGDDNILNELDDFTVATGQANLTSLGLSYTGLIGSGRITATVASPLGGTISGGANVTINHGTPATLLIRGRVGAGALQSELTVAAGTPISLGISAFDAGGNAATTFDGLLSLTFSADGPAISGSIRDSTNATITIGSPTSINFVDGVSSVQANGSNGRMRITSGGATYIIRASGTGITTPSGNELIVTTTGPSVTGILNPEPEVPEEEVPEQTPNRLFLPVIPRQSPANTSQGAPEQSEPGTVRLPTISR